MNLTAADIADDFDLFDFQEAVTVTLINPDTGAVTETASNVGGLRRASVAAEFPVEDGSTHAERCRWHLKAIDLSFVPTGRVQIVDASGVTWIIDPEKEVTTATFGTRYAVETIRSPGSAEPTPDAHNIVSITENGGSPEVTVEADPGFLGGEGIQITGTSGGIYDGNWEVAGMTGPTSFIIVGDFIGSSTGGTWSLF